MRSIDDATMLADDLPAGAEKLGINMNRAYRIHRCFGLQLVNATPKHRVKAKLR